MKKILLLCLSPILFGCVAGQEIALHYNPEPTQKLSDSLIPVTLLIKDARPFIVDHDKEASYLGHYRGGFGNTWDVTNFNNIALSDQLSNDMSKELTALGCSVVENRPGKSITITIKNFNFDAWVNGEFWYDFDIRISNNGRTISESNVKDDTIISGNAFFGAKYAMEKEIPNYYGQIIKTLIRGNPEAEQALTSKP